MHLTVEAQGRILSARHNPSVTCGDSSLYTREP